MVLSIEELKALASSLMKEGLNTQQIADELSFLKTPSHGFSLAPVKATDPAMFASVGAPLAFARSVLLQ